MRPSSDLRPSDPRVEGTKQGGERTKQVGLSPKRKKQGMVDEKSDNFCGGLFVAIVEVWKVNFGVKFLCNQSPDLK